MNELEKLLIEEFVENLSQGQINSLARREKNVRDLLMYDYLKGICTSPRAWTLSDSAFNQIFKANHIRVAPTAPKDFRFKTPKKRMLLDLYRQNLSRDVSAISSRLETKMELKQLYCLDEIYLHLNPNRQERIDFSKDVPSIIDLSIGLYTGQMVALEMKSEIEKFAELANSVDYSNIDVEQIEYLKSKSKKIEDYTGKESSDFEVIKRVQESRELIADLNRRMSDGVKSFTEKVGICEEEIDSISEKKFLSQQEYMGIISNRDSLFNIEDVLRYFGNPEAEGIPKIVEEYSFLIDSHYYFLKNQNRFESRVSKQKRLNRRALKIKSEEKNPVLEYFRRGRVKRYLARTERTLRRIFNFYENRYFKQRLDDEKDDLTGVFGELELNEKWPENIYLKYNEISKKFVVDKP